MIKASLIYITVTVLLAFIDAWRIKKVKGIIENIDHFWSFLFAVIGWWVTAVISLWPLNFNSWDIVWGIISSGVSCLFVRLAIFDLSLNLARRMKIDYESPTTSSYVDQHTNKLSFWEKRAIGLAGWGICTIVYYIIFKK